MNKCAWMGGRIYATKKKILFSVENYPAHPKLCTLVYVEFFPINTVAVLQAKKLFDA